MDCQGFQPEEYGMYALGTLAPAETALIADHINSDCPVCLDGLRVSGRVWTAVGAATVLVQPARSLRRRVIQSVQRAHYSWFWQPWPVLGALSLIAIAWFTGSRTAQLPQIAFSPVYEVPVPPPAPLPRQVEAPARLVPPQVVTREVIREVPKEVIREVVVPDPAVVAALDQERRRSAQLQAQLASPKPVDDTAQRRIAELERQVMQYRVLLDLQKRSLDQNLQLASMLSDPALRVIRLRGTEKGKQIEGHALIAAGGQMAFYASQLPPLPPNRTYQLWLIRSNGQAIASAGTFTPDSSSHAVIQLRDPSRLSAVTSMAVTDEPAGGSPQPTGHKWMIGL
jgi:Anti-sigma-K factor rskA